MRPTRTLVAAVATAIALLAPAAASASPAPGASASATGTARTSSGTTTDANHITASWQLAPGEYACALVVTTADAQDTQPLDPGATSGATDLPATGGTEIKVELQWVAPAVQPERPSDACGAPRNVSAATVTAATYTAPAPPPPAESAAPAPIAAQTSPEPAATTDPATAALIAELRAEVEALRAELAAQLAILQRWAAYEQGLDPGILAALMALGSPAP